MSQSQPPRPLRSASIASRIHRFRFVARKAQNKSRLPKPQVTGSFSAGIVNSAIIRRVKSIGFPISESQKHIYVTFSAEKGYTLLHYCLFGAEYRHLMCYCACILQNIRLYCVLCCGNLRLVKICILVHSQFCILNQDYSSK